MYLEWFVSNNIEVDDSVGIDEVGRGPLAGPVVAASVWISYVFASALNQKKTDLPIRDSKKLTRLQRKKVIRFIEEQTKDSICYAIGSASVVEIDEMNILKASLLAMERSYALLALSKKNILVDGNVLPNFTYNAITSESKPNVIPIIKGDAKVLSISLASIIAKEYRDNIMRELSEEFPQYKWDSNVGYGSKTHLQAISECGVTCHHRKTFSPISKIIHRLEKS